jgi:hypothetical protein
MARRLARSWRYQESTEEGVSVVSRSRSRDISVWVPVSILVIALLSAAGVIYLLDAAPSDRNRVLIGGLAGATASATAFLIGTRGWQLFAERSGQYGILAACTSFVAGFTGGAFSVLLAIGIWPINSRAANLAAPAVFGGVYGLILGALALQLLPGDKAERSSLFGAALQNIQEQLGPPVLVNYDGYLDISAKPAVEQGLVLGRLQGKFAPRQEDKTAPEAAGEKRSRILIQGGAEQDTVPFVLSIVGNSAVSGYPRRMTVQAPADRSSEVFEFTLVREAEETEADGDRNAPDQGERVTVLLDVSQGGRTIQLVELGLNISAGTG